jgi:hypothetical protein
MKSKNRVRSLLLTDQLWDDLNVIAAKSRKTRAEIIREALAAACAPKNLPTSVFRPADPDMSGLHRAPDPLPWPSAVPARAAQPKPAPPPEPRGFRPGSAGQIYRDCFGEPPPGMYDEHGNTIDTSSPDDSIDANDDDSDEYGDDTGDEGSEEEAREPDADARDARPH